MIDQTIGKLVESKLITNNSGRPITRESQVPKSAPMKPRAMDTRKPPREKPLMACPTDPQMPATRSNRRNSSRVMTSPRERSRTKENESGSTAPRLQHHVLEQDSQ